MSAYDRAHELARDLSRTEEYRNYVESKTKLEQDQKNVEMLEQFRHQQWEVQMAQVAGQEVDEAKVQQLEKLYQVLSLNPIINEFLNAEYRFARLMADIQKILADAVPAWFDFGGRRELIN
ncbi:hypothetical protein SY88_03825 [Clostridiales bacterium PH28_bin88]|nr:hypothetical protein SY88_03825 [Clostridiales bacterium PH28_bin88]